MKKLRQLFNKFQLEIIFLFGVYAAGLYFRFFQRLSLDPHLLTFNADIWYRLAISQYIYDHGHASAFSIRYLPYTFMPEWYPPVFPHFLVFLARLFHVDLPTASSRIIPFFEAMTPVPFFILARYLYGNKIAVFSTITLGLTSCFVYWTGISDPQSFIAFSIPLVILLWTRYSKTGLNSLSVGKRAAFILGLGAFLGFCFITHLMYFLMLIILLSVNLSLIIEKKAEPGSYMDLVFAVLVSQIITVWWWLPRKLYWWWLHVLVTSSGFQLIGRQLDDYGAIAAIMGVASFVFVIIYCAALKKKKKLPYILLPVFWAAFPLLETQNEVVLKILNRTDLTWLPLFKPLEGFRFHMFLAQPLALCMGICIVALIEKIAVKKRPAVSKKARLYAVCALLIAGALFYDIQVLFNFKGRIQKAGININEYNAALWFRENSRPTDRIVCDYYRTQMLAGVCGGRAFLGLPFPLRNVKVKYINTKEVQDVRDAVYTIYATPLSGQASALMRRYGLSHVFISEAMDKTANFGSLFYKGFGARIDREKFKDANFFEVVYNKNGVLIAKVKDRNSR